jgi:GT2 family glycosyltransferase
MPLPVLDPKTYVIIVNWNGWKDTLACLESVFRLNYNNFVVIVCDNNSSDGSQQRISEWVSESGNAERLILMRADRNLGFAGGNNLALRHILDQDDHQYIWLLNNDTTVHPEALCELVGKAEANPGIGAVGSAIYSMAHPGALQAWGGGYVSWLGRSHHFLAPVEDKQLQFLTGASLLVRREALRTVGLLDDTFFLYWEDTDYCFRLRYAGWRLSVAGTSKINHKGQGSIGPGSPLLDFYFSRSAVRFFNRHAILPVIPLWTSITLRLGKRILSGNWKGVRGVWTGFRHNGTSS